MKKILCLPLMLTVLAACQTTSRLPSSFRGTVDLKSGSQQVLQDLQNPRKFNLETCPSYLSGLYKGFTELSPDNFNVSSVRQDWEHIYRNLWLTRVKLRERIIEFAAPPRQTTDPRLQACINASRDAFRLARWLEDYLVENFSDIPQDFKAGDPGHKLDPNFKITPLQGEAPWLVKNPKFSDIKIRSGDVIISRGNAYTSSAIARIGNIDAQFSHLAFIYIPGEGTGREYTIEQAIANKNILIIEAHIEIGSTIRPIAEYLQDGNARNVLFRYKNPSETAAQSARVAHNSAKWVHDYIEDYRRKAHRKNPSLPISDVNYSVPYNFQMDNSNPDDPQKLFCSQVASVGFHHNGVTVPQFISTMTLSSSLISRMGITSPVIFAPGDLEVDSRFEMIAEYRDVRKLQGLRMKDMVLTSMHNWMEKEEDAYTLRPDPLLTSKALIAWVSRQMDLKFVKNRLPKTMEIKIMNSMFVLDKVATSLEIELDKYEKDYQSRNMNLKLPYTEGLNFLENLRAQDLKVYLAGSYPLFHYSFRPKSAYAYPPENNHSGQ